MTIRAAADGSALGNPGPAGWAWYVDDNCWAAGGWSHATNNQGELMAVLQLFRATAHLSDDLLILCDSQYVINSVTKWMPGWKKKGWKKSDGKPVMNLELLQQIDAALVGRKYRFEWVKGHANHPLNEAADSRARAVSEAFQRGRPIPTGPGFNRVGDVAAPVTAPADGSGLPAASGTPRISGAPAATSSAASRPDVTSATSAGSSAPVVPGATAAARAARNAQGQGIAAAAPAKPIPASAPTLFSFDDTDSTDNAPVQLSVRLTAAQHSKLAQLAARQGITPEQALANLL